MSKKTTTHYRYEEVKGLSLPDTVLISINGGETEPPILKDWASVHFFRFDDIVPHNNVEWPGIGISPRYKGNNPKTFGYDPMTLDHAEHMAEVIRINWDKSIHVQCAAGVSRSAAVAKVLSELGWEYVLPEARPYGFQHANQHVVSLLRAQFPERFSLIGQ